MNNDAAIIIKKHIKLVGTGDFEFYMTILGRVNMSSSWCFWCKQRMAEWKKDTNNNADIWTLNEIKRCVEEEIKCAGIVKLPIWDAIEINFYILSLLHLFLGMGNDIIDSFFRWVNIHIIKLTPEQMALLK